MFQRSIYVKLQEWAVKSNRKPLICVVRGRLGRLHMPHLCMIAAGSRLQSLLKELVSFPVGRVEYFCSSIEVKSGHNAHLRSLQSFMDLSSGDLAIRIWSSPYSIDMVSTPKGKKFRLINIPFYYIGSLLFILKKSRFCMISHNTSNFE